MVTSEMLLLDCGCGSGNYLKAVRPLVKTGTGLEFNEGMIAQAVGKFPPGSGVEVVQGSITDMPFGDGSFDAALATQVLHHLVRGGSVGTGVVSFANVERAAVEVARCLRPGGVWVVSTQTPRQHVDGFWWSPVVPKAAAALATHFPPLGLLREILAAAGFSSVRKVVPPEPLVAPELYLDLEGPFREEFRNADSTWALVGEAELAQGLAMLRRKIDGGTAAAWLAEREGLRAAVGQTTTVIATKPLE